MRCVQTATLTAVLGRVYAAKVPFAAPVGQGNSKRLSHTTPVIRERARLARPFESMALEPPPQAWGFTTFASTSSKLNDAGF